MASVSLRRIVLGIVVAAIAAAAIWAFWPKPVGADLATIRRGPLEVTVEDEGVTRIRDVYTVSAPITGKMLRTHRKVGDAVVAWETDVATIEPIDPEFLDVRSQRVSEAAVQAANAAVDLAEAQLNEARSQLQFAQSELSRATELAAKQAISPRALEKSRIDVAIAEAAVASARASVEVRRRELQSAQARLLQPTDPDTQTANCCVQIRAPISGSVLRVIAESERVVQAGTPLIEIGDANNLELVVDLLSRDAVRVPDAAMARIEAWGGDAVLNARVRRIEPAGFTKVSALGIEEQRVRVILDFTDAPEKWNRLGHAFRVVARIIVWQGGDELQVPLGALFRRDQSWAVFVVKNGRTELRKIEIGQRNIHAAQVLSGLSEGEQVILHPSDQIQDGVSVAPRS
ncbi:MAG: HlyD family efflux transporter periplasmic adaptor subunit [Bradyrhizobiaceae bacterium]|nr:HlyD family efflux transporter periplasmic adaptor subunit [Bradyrhizobiaceae bacterium]